MRYTPHTKEDVEAMLKEIGAPSIKRLYADIPKDLRAKKLKLADGIAEADAERELVRLSQKNKRFDIVLRGAGAYDHYIPPVVKALTSRSEFVTAYTPYQAELSQGILQSIFEYQTIICRLTAMDASNA
ncbi:MAG TPA: aminomethyl-transferring glycine dehydrogenase, partial [Clostridia bacterium]|nr:aminomethyl-transferring glycine dehydrogenase [Clostridia bacterium]